MITTCHQCAYSKDKTGANSLCVLLGKNVQLDSPSCGEFYRIKYNCTSCGKQIYHKEVLFYNDKPFCKECAAKFGSCAHCKFSGNCAFEEDPNPIPKLIQQQVRVPQGIAVTTVMNPKRIEITCQKGCSCFDKENKECNRNYKLCSDYNEKEY